MGSLPLHVYSEGAPNTALPHASYRLLPQLGRFSTKALFGTLRSPHGALEQLFPSYWLPRVKARRVHPRVS